MVQEDSLANNSSELSQRKIHINLPEEIHQQLRIKCAVNDVSIQEFVAEIISRSVSGVRVVESGDGKTAI